MIYKNEDGTNVIQFGTGDIEVGNGRILESKGKKSFPCCIFAQSDKRRKIGESINPGHEDDPDEERSDSNTTFIFTDPRSIDVVISHLFQAKERFKKNGTKVLTRQEITDELPLKESTK